MKLLKDKITSEGRVLSEHILKVDSFLNHQIDPALMFAIGSEFKKRFGDCGVTKVLTVESSGIAPAITTALEYGVNVVFARKRKSLTLSDGLISADVFSYTKNEITTISISKDYLTKDDKVLIIDDFLANGEVIKGLREIISQTGATIVGIGIVIEKSFQKGREIVDESGLHIESLARIKSLANGTVEFVD